MHITTEEHGDSLELRIAGRLDNEWAEQLTSALNEHVRQGSHTVVLDLSEVSYVSSAGIGALVRAHKQFQSIRGFFGVGLASEPVAEVIKMTGLAQMLMCDIEKVRKGGNAFLATNSLASLSGVSVSSGIYFDSYTIKANALLTCEIVGNPERFPRNSFAESDCQQLDFPAETFGLGLGAFGRTFTDCEDRFGEFLAVSGTAAYLPTSKAGKPDYQVAQGNFIPQVQVAYGLRCRGEFRQLQRFESGTDGGRVAFSTLVDECLSMSDTDLAGITIVAETSGLIGAALKRSPAVASESAQSKLSHPEIRRWLSFSPEQAFSRSIAVVVGIASRGDPERTPSRSKLAPMLRPLRLANDLFGHFHAAVFSYRPFKKRKLDLNATVGALFETEDLQTVLHLLNDDRAITGAGESEFTRGACWVGPISTVTGGTSR